MTTHNHDALIALLQCERATIQALNTLEATQDNLTNFATVDLFDIQTVCEENTKLIKLVDVKELTERSTFCGQTGAWTLCFVLNHQRYILRRLIRRYCEIITK